MIFNTYLGNVSSYQDKLRLVLNKPVKTREHYDAIMKMFSDYLFTEGFMMSRAEARIDGYTNEHSAPLEDVKNILSDTPKFWKLELYNKRNQLITRDTFVA